MERLEDIKSKQSTIQARDPSVSHLQTGVLVGLSPVCKPQAPAKLPDAQQPDPIPFAPSSLRRSSRIRNRRSHTVTCTETNGQVAASKTAMAAIGGVAVLRQSLLLSWRKVPEVAESVLDGVLIVSEGANPSKPQQRQKAFKGETVGHPSDMSLFSQASRGCTHGQASKRPRSWGSDKEYSKPSMATESFALP